MNNRIINKEVLESVEPGSIIASGFFTDCDNTSICDTGKRLPWVAVRGQGAPDWAVYTQPIYSDELLFPKVWDKDLIRRMGDKFPKHMVDHLFDEVSKHAYYWYRS